MLILSVRNLDWRIPFRFSAKHMTAFSGFPEGKTSEGGLESSSKRLIIILSGPIGRQQRATGVDSVPDVRGGIIILLLN